MAGITDGPAQMTLLAVLSLYHVLVTRKPLLGEDLLTALQHYAAVWVIDFRVLAAVRKGKTGLVMNEAFNEVFLPGTNDLAVDLAVVRLRPKVLRVGRMSSCL